jgi:hypothetical protein
MADPVIGTPASGGTTSTEGESSSRWKRLREKARQLLTRKKPQTLSGETLNGIIPLYDDLNQAMAEYIVASRQTLESLGNFMADVQNDIMYIEQRVPPTTLSFDVELYFEIRIRDTDHAERIMILDDYPVMIRGDRVVSGTTKVAAAVFLNIRLITVRQLDVDYGSATDHADI